MIEGNRGAHRIAGGDVQINATDFGHTRAQSMGQIHRWTGVANRIAQDFAGLFFHGPAMLGRTHTQAALDVIIEISNRDARHVPAPVFT